MNNLAWTQGARAAALPGLLIALLIALFLYLDPLSNFDQGPPPPEHLDIERVQIDERGFQVQVRANSNNPITLAQVMVDGAYWQFSASPQGALRRNDTALIRIDFPWVSGETHHLRFISSIGGTFDHAVDTALKTPQASTVLLVHYAILGLFVGVIPIALGMLFFPAIKALGAEGLEFLLALTLGLLAYLFLDMTLEGLELAAAASDLFGGAVLVLIPMAFTVSLLVMMSSRTRAHSGLSLALLVASGIGLHNFGEGLAIGAAFANHEVTLGAFLIIGFTLHNTTEGIAIVSPLVHESVKLARLFLLALLAGLPVIGGIWLGAFMFSAHWAAIFFGIGAGAVLQVIGEIDHYLEQRLRHGTGRSRFSPASVAGYGCGLALMYTTSLLITL